MEEMGLLALLALLAHLVLANQSPVSSEATATNHVELYIRVD